MRTNNTGCGIAIVILIIIGLIMSAVESIFSNILNVLVFITGIILILVFPKIIDSIKERKNTKNKTTDTIINFENYRSSNKNIKLLKIKTEIIYQKLININTKINKLVEYVELVRQDYEDNSIAKIIEKQNEIIKYLAVYYDKYASIFLELYLQLEIERYKKIKNKNIDVKEYIFSMTNDTDKIISFVKNFPVYPEIEHIEINKSIGKINKTLKNIKASLVSYHSNMILNNISPIEDDFDVNNKEDNDIIIEIDDLTNQYERFIQEISISNNNF
jgi:hypothetical protein